MQTACGKDPPHLLHRLLPHQVTQDTKFVGISKSIFAAEVKVTFRQLGTGFCLRSPLKYNFPDRIVLYAETLDF